MRQILICLYLLLFVGQAHATAPDLLLAQVYQGQVDLADYWVSEKYDGVRAYWDGRELRFRSGRKVHAPEWFIGVLPRQPLDGELWLGRGKFDALSGIVRREVPVEAEWRQVRYLLFELPGAPGTFTQRLEALQAVVRHAGVSWLQAAPQFRVADARALQSRLREVVKGGGEGLMLHRADAPYLTGRHAALLKVTPWRDAEATVIGHLPGKGALAGMLGALRLRLDSGVEFSLGSGLQHRERRDPPAIGSVITFRYRELSREGVPRFARFLRRHQPL